MWKPLKINGENYFFQCELLNDGKMINYTLCDLKFIWSENISMEIFSTKMKDLNKRIEYKSETVLKAINSKIPDEINLTSDKKDTPQENELRNLKLKYYISGCPLIFLWNLKLCDQTEFLKLITNPLLLSLACLTRQNDELVDIIQKKDIEIEQYKQEGAILRRTKIATELYNNDKLKQKFPKILISENILIYANENLNNLKKSCKEFIVENVINDDLSHGNTSGSTISSVQKTSPVKSKKKRFLQQQKQLLEQRLKASEKKIDYEDSDSACSPPIIENIEVIEIKRRLSELKRKHEEDLENSKKKETKS